MEVLDVNGKQICKGLRVKYIRTHTMGKVTNILIKDNFAWIKLDSNGLYYRSDYIEVIENIEADKRPKMKKSIKSEKFKVTTPTEISDPADGPGYGGG
jgi:hypothetical protein